MILIAITACMSSIILYQVDVPPIRAVDLEACSEVNVYSGEVCRGELTSLQVCISGMTHPSPRLHIPTIIDQKRSEKDAARLLNGLAFLSPSKKCKEAVTPFLCLNIFNLCDSNSTLHTITRGDCVNIRDDVCASEWIEATTAFGPEVLPTCEDLPNLTEVCIGKISECVSTLTP